jgi:hypothetical protein
LARQANRIVVFVLELGWADRFWTAAFLRLDLESFDLNRKRNRRGFGLNTEKASGPGSAAADHSEASFVSCARRLSPKRYANEHPGDAIQPCDFFKRLTDFAFSANHAKTMKDGRSGLTR